MPGELIFSVALIVGGILAIAVRRHVRYPLWRHRRTDEIVQIIAGTISILFGAAWLLLLLYRTMASN